MRTDKYVSGRLIRKSSKFLKISISLFAFSLILISVFLTLFFNQYLQIEKDFLTNDYTHMIEITCRVHDNMAYNLGFADLPAINRKLGNDLPNASFTGINEYQFNFGIIDDQNNIVWLHALDNFCAQFFGKEEFQKNCLYSRSLQDGTTKLLIPVIDEEDPFVSIDMIELVCSNDNDIPEKTPFTLNEILLADQTFISFDTYKTVIEKAFTLSWEDFVKRYDAGEEMSIQPVKKIFIYVDDIRNVEKIASVLDRMGYATNYTFKSFENFSESIKTTILVAAILIAIVFLITSAYIVLSFNSYLKVQQKDMGILRHYGYNTTRINKIYARNINKIFVLMALFITLLIGAFGYIFLGLAAWQYILIVLGGVLIPLYIVNRIITCFTVRSYSKKPFLDLVKTNKEFE